jgi:hypothetical protein
MKCTVCTHPQRQAIDHALLAGDATYEALSAQYGPSLSAIYRHKKHLQEKMRQAEKRLQNHLRQDTLFRFNEYLETTRQVVRTASADGDTRQTLRAVREGTRILNFITKLEVKFDGDLVYRIIASPQFTTQDSLLPTDPGIITSHRQTLADHLFFPCPELVLPDLDDEEEAGDEIAEAAEAEKAAEIPRLLARLDLDPSPASPVWRETRNSALETFQTENHPLKQREMSAKLPRKSRPAKHNNQQNHSSKSIIKTFAKKPPVGRESDAPPAVQPSPTLRLDSNPKPFLETGNQKPETVITASDAPPAKPSPTLPVNSRPELPPRTGNRKSETLAVKLKTFFRPQPQPVSTKNCQPKTAHRFCSNPVPGLRSWFKQLTTKRPPDPPLVVYEPGWNIISIKTERQRQGTY